MRTHVDRICVALPAAAVFCVSALSAGPARAFPPGPTPIMRVPAGTYPAARGLAPPQRFIAAPPQRVIVIYRNGDRPAAEAAAPLRARQARAPAITVAAAALAAAAATAAVETAAASAMCSSRRWAILPSPRSTGC
ncbi:MAG: hypothetical protein WCD82_22390 [Xanthobacteraceae bacterium]